MNAQITIASAYKGRRDHAEQAIPQNIANANAAAVPIQYHILDFNCPQGTGEWAAQLDCPELSVFKNYDEPYWSPSVAQNTALAHTTTPWIVMVMGDNILSIDFFQFLKTIEPGKVYTYQIGQCPDTCGTVVIERQAFAAIGGYDERIQGWGNDDHNLIIRAKLYGLTHAHWPLNSVTAIPHSEDVRFGLQREPVTRSQALENHATYLSPASFLANAHGRREVFVKRLK